MKLTNKKKQFISQFETFYINAVNPRPSANARIIASWPTKQKSSLTGIGRIHKGPLNKGSVYRVW